MAAIKNNGALKCLLMIVVSLLLVFKFTIWVSASSGYNRQEADACIIISQRLSVKGGSEKQTLYHFNDYITATLMYYYPQGAIFMADNVIINYKGKVKVNIHDELRMKVIGYDDTNMWIITR